MSADQATEDQAGLAAPDTNGRVATRRPRLQRSGLWKNGDFLKFWAGETVSLFGSQVTSLALPLTAVLTLSVSAQQLGMLRFSQFVAFLLLPLPFGLWADRRRRLPLMVIANASRAALIGVVPLLVLLDQLNLPALYVIAFGIGAFTVLFDVCWMSVLPALVANKDHIVEANGKVGTSYSAAEVAGPGFAGVLVQAVTAPFALVIDACSYVVSVISLKLIRTSEPAPEARPAGERRLTRELGEGLRFVFGNPYLRVIAVLGSAYNFFFMFTEAIFLLYAIRSLSFSPSLLGLVLSASAVGGLLGALLSARLTRRFPLGTVYTCAVVIGYFALLLIPAASGPRWLVAVMFVAAFFLTTAGIGVANVVAISLRQTVTPTHLMGRMTAAMRMLMYGLGSLGALASGFVAAGLGLRSALTIAAVGSSLSVLPLVFSSIPRLRTLPPAADS